MNLKVKFTLTMENLIVENNYIDNITISWISDVSQQEVLDMSQEWITTKDFLTQKMTGLQKVGESSLTIEPVEESAV
ncbi:MAG: hypothetical protein MUO85_01815 [candidate division Zixibacteria bacterium]|nr:hypothetical protein [candidate division Zixibacteria bacterium]